MARPSALAAAVRGVVLAVLREQPPPVRLAVVAAVGTGTVDLSWAGGTATVTGVRHLASYTPVAGDAVWVLAHGQDLLVLGRTA